MYIVSKCLLGINCKYNGGNNRNDDVLEFCKTHDYVTICPEMAGGLESPRPPAEIVKDGSGRTRVVNTEGLDVTCVFIEGAEKSLEKVMNELKERGYGTRIEGAILKANSPSCGSGTIYDGTFSGNKTQGNGVFTDLMTDTRKREMKATGDLVPHCVFSEDFTIVDENNISKLVNR